MTSKRHRNTLGQRIRENKPFYGFILPYFIVFGLFSLYPIIFSAVLSFVEWDGLTPMRWVGLNNFRIMLADEVLLKALANTVVIGLYYIPPMFGLAFIFALLLNAAWLKCRDFLRVSFFIPCITPMVAICVVFSLLYSPESGMINIVLQKFGFEPIAWLMDARYSKIALAILLVWRWTGYNMIIMLAGLTSLPHELYESARIDGAGWWHQIRHITLPLMKPVFTFCSITSLIGTLYMFDEVFVLTNGGPGASSMNLGLYLFNVAFADYKFGYASCVAYSVASVVFVISLFLLRQKSVSVTS